MFIKIILFPFACLYDLVTRIRNVLYQKGIFQSFSFPVFIVSVGNLTVGGTGKTPHVEYLIRFFINLLDKEKTEKKQVAFLSRGYGRKTKGVIIANETPNIPINATTIGDEPMQLLTKFANQITTAVGEKRALAISKILRNIPQTQVIVLDDAYQHRAVERNVNILLTDYYRPFYKDFLLPVGRLRESRQAADRADIIIVTKCPSNLPLSEKETIKAQIQKYARNNTPIFFTTFQYGQMLPLHENKPIFDSQLKNLILVTGIADATSLVEELKKRYQLIKHFQFADHYEYTEATVNQIISEYQKQNAKQACAILITEKDKVKLSAFNHFFKEIPIFYIPIEVHFLGEEKEFLKLLRVHFK